MKAILLGVLFLSTVCFSQNIRPVMDNIGFIWKKSNLEKLTDYFEKNKLLTGVEKRVVAAVCPHDDYLYAGDVEYSVLRNIKAKEVIIFGVTHRSPRKFLNNPKNLLIFDKFDVWQGLDNNVSISPLRELLKKQLSSDNYIVNNKAHSLEHSIESLLPWIQYNNSDFKLTPVMVSEMDFETMDKLSDKVAKIIATYIKDNKLQLGKDIVILSSCDATHYGKDFNYFPYGLDGNAHTQVVENDKELVKDYLEGEISGKKIKGFLSEKEKRAKLWCGKYSVPFGVLTAYKVAILVENKGIIGKLTKYSDSYSNGVFPVHISGAGITAPFSLEHFVGYAGVTFSLK